MNAKLIIIFRKKISLVGKNKKNNYFCTVILKKERIKIIKNHNIHYNQINHIIMKKILLFLFLAMPVMGFAQKSYVIICVSDGLGSKESHIGGATMSLSGDIPSGIKDSYNTSDDITSGKIMCLLSEKGYELEKAFLRGSENAVIIMSKNGSSTSSKIQSIKIEDEGEPYEVARYNLQGIPVKSYEKGVQVIVFSNYTTKTVVVE